MLPSVCAARFFGCTAMPASIAAQKLCTLILPVARSTDTSATPAASVSSFSMMAMPSAVPVALARPVRHLGDGAQQMSACAAAPSDSSSRNASGSLPRSLRDLVEEALDRKGVVAVADAAPRRQAARRASRSTCSASLFGIGYCGIGEPFITMRSLAGGVRAARDDHVGDDRFRRPRDGARRSACRWHRSPPRCGARSSAGTCRRSRSSSRLQTSLTGLPTALERRTASSTTSCCARRPKPPPRKCWCSVILLGLGLQHARDLGEQAVGACVPAQISADLPSALTEAVAFSGSICAW